MLAPLCARWSEDDMSEDTLGRAIDTLAATIAARAGADPATSYTASLLAGGAPKCAKKLGEEAVEAALAAVSGDKVALAHEAADVLFHLLATLQACGVPPADVAAALVHRRSASGHDEKASRG
jgi:phosphoribosyl-ATP pyrophosphohydrolase